MKFGIIGTNFISDGFMDAAKHCNDFSLAAVSGTSIAKAEAFGEKYGCTAGFDDYKKMIESGLCEAIYVATPNAMHKDMGLYALEHHLPVLIEKPLASNAKEVEELIDASIKYHTLMMEALVPVPTSNFKLLKQEVSTLGTIRRAVFNFGKYSSRYDNYRKGIVENAFKAELSNGSVMDIGVYSLGVALALFGKPEEIHANAILLSTGVDGSGSVLLKYKDKEVIVTHAKSIDTFVTSEIQGEDGTIQIDGVSIMKGLRKAMRKQAFVPFDDPDEKPWMYYEVREFIDCVKAGKIESDSVPHSFSLLLHEVITEIRRQTGVVFPADKA
ncbi:MAG: Gfo/Idh/MocA family oxidoreductase [Erysipelotrichaceae bacterium]|jgi:predicted dehydrogenase|nr:Gfo/Idh/MocA family oxidoreductase [Erysipelotrichaceae bacterium]